MRLRKGWYRALPKWKEHFKSKDGLVFVEEVDYNGYFKAVDDVGKFHPSWAKFLVKCSVKEYVTKLNN